MFKTKAIAAAIHLAICVVVAAFVLGIVYAGWYPEALAATQGIGSILLIVIVVDVVLGPCLTFLVYKTGKKSLKFDLAAIGLAQFLFLGYGVYTIEQARPAFLVFVKDRFEPVAISDWAENDAKRASPEAVSNLFSMKVVAGRLPTDAKEKEELMFSSAAGGADIHNLPRYYVPYKSLAIAAASRSESIDNLRAINAKSLADLNLAVKRLGLPDQDLGFLPLNGRMKDAAVILRKADGEILAILPFKAWPEG